jgi:hypothetical protein
MPNARLTSFTIGAALLLLQVGLQVAGYQNALIGNALLASVKC